MFKSTIAEPRVHNVHIVHIRQCMYVCIILIRVTNIVRNIRLKKKGNFNKKKYTFISRKKSRVASWFLNSNFVHCTNGKSENFIYIWKIQTQKLIILSDYKFKKKIKLKLHIVSLHLSSKKPVSIGIQIWN